MRRYSQRRRNPDIDFYNMLLDESLLQGSQLSLYVGPDLSTREQVFKALATLAWIFRLCGDLDKISPKDAATLSPVLDSIFSVFYFGERLKNVRDGKVDGWVPRKDGVSIGSSISRKNVHTTFEPFFMFEEEIDNQYTGDSDIRPARDSMFQNDIYLKKIAKAIVASLRAPLGNAGDQPTQLPFTMGT